MKRKRILLAIFAVFCFLAMVAVVVASWFRSEGIHALGPFVHVEMTADCWVYDPEEGTVLDDVEVHLSVHGYTCDLPFDDAYGCGLFNGTVTSDAFPPIQELQTISADSMHGGVLMRFTGRTFSDDVERGIKVDFDSQSYDLYIDWNGNFLMYVTEGLPGRAVIVHADSPEDVPTVYRELLVTQPFFRK